MYTYVYIYIYIYIYIYTYVYTTNVITPGHKRIRVNNKQYGDEFDYT